MEKLRCIQANDIVSLAELLNDIFRRQNNVFDQEILADFPLVFVPENYCNCRVIEVDGELVSHAAIFPCQFSLKELNLKMAVVVLVATDKEFRKRGYAARLMQDLQRTMKEEAYDLGILWTGYPSFYRKLGWEVFTPEGWFTKDLRFKVPLLEQLTSKSEHPERIERFDLDRHLAGVVKLHENESVRTQRSWSEYATLLTLPKTTVWVSKRDHQVSAYVVVGQAINKQGIIEFGGSVDDVLSLIKYSLHAQSLDRELPLIINHLRGDLFQRFKEVGEPLYKLESSKGLGCEMVYIVQPNNLFPKSLDKLFIWGLDYT